MDKKSGNTETRGKTLILNKKEKSTHDTTDIEKSKERKEIKRQTGSEIETTPVKSKRKQKRRARDITNYKSPEYPKTKVRKPNTPK